MKKFKKIKEFIFGEPDLSDDNINRVLVRLAIPTILVIIVGNLYNIIDTMFIGRYIGGHAIGALRIAFPFMSIMIAGGMMISTGGMSVLSRALGEKNLEKAKTVFGNALTLVVSSCLIFTGLILLLLDKILRLMGATGELLILGKDYMGIIILGSVFMASAQIFGQLLRAEGKAKESMMVLAIGTITNIVLDYIFIVVLTWGVKGAALATTIANVISFIYAIIMVTKKGTILEFKIKYFKIKLAIIKEIIAIGMSSFISQGAGSVGMMIANRVMSDVGGTALITSMGIFATIQNIVFMPISGVTQGMQPILGYNYGAKRLDKIKETVNLTLRYVFGIALINSILAIIFTKEFITVFLTGDNQVLQSIPYMRMALAFAAIGAWQWVGGTVFRSVGMAKKAYLFSILRMIVIFVPTIIILGNTIGIIGCWLAYSISDLISGIISKGYLNRFLGKLEIN